MGLHTREPAVAVSCGDDEDFENDGDDDYSDENDYDYICKYDSSNDRGSGYDKSSDDYSCIDDDSSDDGDDIDNDDDDGGSGDATDNLCAICDNGGKLLCCEGQCKRSFHPRVKDGRESNNCETLGLTSAQLQEIDHYLCKNCEHKQHQCFSCGDLEPSDGPNAKVFQCYKASCGHFYHPSCIAKLLEPDDTDGAHELKKRIAAGMSFTCPAHWCSECRTMEDSTQPDLWLAACRRCPVSYHKKCLPRSISFERKRGTSVRAWHLGDRIIIYCGRHKLEAALGAPSRDHIKLPSSTEMDTVRAHCMDQTKSTPVPKIYRTRNLAKKKTEVTGKRKMNTDQGSTGTAELSNKVCREEADHIKLTPVPKIYRTRNLAKKTKVTGKRKMNTDQGSTGTAELSNKVCREEVDQIQIVDMNSLREDSIPKGRGVLERETIRLNQAQNDEVEKLIVEEQAEEDENDTKSGKERETHRRENTYGEKENTPGNKSNKFGLTNRRFTSGSDGDREVDGSHACQQELKSPHCNDNHKATGIDTSSDKSGKRQRQEEHATDGNMLNLERNRKKFHMETGRDAHQSPQRLHNHKKPDARQSSCCSSSKNHPLCNDDMAIPESPPKADPKPPSPSTTVEDTVLPDVLITGTGYQSPKPHVLTRHTDKAKANSPEELEFEFPVLEKLSADELHAGYLNRLSTSRNMELKLVGLMKKKYEEALKAADSELTGVKENLAAQQTARSEAEKKWRVAVKELEKTQADFAAFKKTAESKQAALTKRADDAESRLKVTSEELQTLKHHIFRMTFAIFGERSRQLSSDSLLKLKAVYSLAEQLYCGTLCTIKAMLTEKSIPKHMKGVIELLSTLPKQIEELKRSSARHGAMVALSRSLAFAPELTAEEMIDGFPSKKDDGSEFTEADYAKCRKASRVLASTLVNEMDLSSYQAAYGEDNKRLRGPTFEARDLTPARRKQLFAPDIDPSSLFDRAQFEALTHCNWDVDNLQIEEVEDPAKDDSPAS